MTMGPIKLRLELREREMQAVRVAARCGRAWCNRVDVTDPSFFEELVTHNLAGVAFASLEHMAAAALAAERRLAWWPAVRDAVTLGFRWEALLGGPSDGVLFALTCAPDAGRLGRWCLAVEVLGGPLNRAWGVYGPADQPVRYYFDLGNALAEAESLAAAFLECRRTPLTPGTPDNPTE